MGLVRQHRGLITLISYLTGLVRQYRDLMIIVISNLINLVRLYGGSTTSDIKLTRFSETVPQLDNSLYQIQ